MNAGDPWCTDPACRCGRARQTDAAMASLDLIWDRLDALDDHGRREVLGQLVAMIEPRAYPAVLDVLERTAELHEALAVLVANPRHT